jgi:hypothetical protein
MFVLLLLVIPAVAFAVPAQIPYSGQLSESGSLVTGSRDLTISVYADSTGGSAIYTETFASVSVQNGVFHLNLNPGQSVWDGSIRWVGVSVNGAVELTPRMKVGTVPYAVRANEAAHAAIADTAVHAGTAGYSVPIIWSGGCTHHGSASGWNVYCNDGVDFNTASDYLTTDGTGNFNFLKSGYYRVSFWTISYGTGSCDLLFVKNEATVYYNVQYVAGLWTYNHGDQAIPFQVGDILQVRVNNPNSTGGYAYHQWRAIGSTSVGHSRLQIQYLGPLN